MRKRRSRWIIAGLVMLLGCSDGDDDGGAPTMPAGTTVGSLVAGTGGYVDGVFVWTDYAYDDRGANADAAAGGDRTDSSRAGGDARYPETLAVNNAADLVQLQIYRDASDSLVVRAVLETLVDPTLPVVAVAFDTDADPRTGAAELPGGRWATDRPLGVDTLLELSSAGGRLWSASGGAWTVTGGFASTADANENLITALVPAAMLPAMERWRVVAAVGLGTEDGNWLDGAADIFDLAFVGREPFVRWQDNLQADILAGVLDADLAVGEIDFAVLAGGATTLTDDLTPGFHTLLYRSELVIAEGVDFDENSSPIFLGPFQPYLVYIPENLPQPSPVSVFLHGSDQNHLGAVFQQPGDFYIGTGRALSEDPHLIAALGFAGDGFDFPPHTLQVYPLARGGRLGYRGIAHQDVLDVLADTMRRFDVDPDRVILQGASMGGIGAYRLATLQPDKWSVALPLIGFQAPELLPLSVNLRNVPVRQINGAADPLIPVEPAEASAKRLDELGIDYRYWLLSDRGHEAGGFVYDCVFAAMSEFERNRHPATIAFLVDPRLDEIDESTGLELRFDSAYWISDIRARDRDNVASVYATSYALPLADTFIERIDRIVDNTTVGADLCGPNPEVQTGDEWRERAVELQPVNTTPSCNELNAELRNVASVIIDLAGASIDVTQEAYILISTDVPCEVGLSGLRAGQDVTTVTALGATVTASDTGTATVGLSTPGSVFLRVEP